MEGLCYNVSMHLCVTMHMHMQCWMYFSFHLSHKPISITKYFGQSVQQIWPASRTAHIPVTTHKHVRTNVHKYKNTYTYIHAHGRAGQHTSKQAHTCTHTHAPSHTHTHTHTHTHPSPQPITTLDSHHRPASTLTNDPWPATASTCCASDGASRGFLPGGSGAGVKCVWRSGGLPPVLPSPCPLPVFCWGKQTEETLHTTLCTMQRHWLKAHSVCTSFTVQVPHTQLFSQLLITYRGRTDRTSRPFQLCQPR